MVMLEAVYGAVAVELAAGARPRSLIERPQALALGNALSAELARQLPSLEGLGLCWMAGSFDIAQLLRPGWPLFDELKRIYQAGVRDPLAEPQVITLSALRGKAPSAVLEPDTTLLGESLIYLPFAIVGPVEFIEPARQILEELLLEQGLVDARCARLLIDALQAPVEHARLLTRDDLCAITAANLQHSGMPGLWQAIEIALFLPKRSIDVNAEDGLRFSVIDGVVHLHSSAAEIHEGEFEFADRLPLLRQAIGTLEAHHVPWRILPSRAATASLVEIDEAGFWIEWHAEPAAIAQVVRVSNSASQLLWLELLDSGQQTRAHGFPLHSAGLQALLQRLHHDGQAPGQSARTLSLPQ